MIISPRVCSLVCEHVLKKFAAAARPVHLQYMYIYLSKIIICIVYRVSQKNVLIDKIITQIECCGAKFYHEYDLERLD